MSLSRRIINSSKGKSHKNAGRKKSSFPETIWEVVWEREGPGGEEAIKKAYFS